MIICVTKKTSSDIHNKVILFNENIDFKYIVAIKLKLVVI